MRHTCEEVEVMGSKQAGGPRGSGGQGGCFCFRRRGSWNPYLNLDRGHRRGADRSWGDRDPVRREHGGPGKKTGSSG